MKHWEAEIEMLDIIEHTVTDCCMLVTKTFSKHRRELAVKLLAIKANIQSVKQQIRDDHKSDAPSPSSTGE